MPRVTMPDGQVVEMPDNPSAEQLAALKKLAQPESALDTVKRWAGDIGRGFVTNLTGLAEGAAAFNAADRPSFKKVEGKTVVGPSTVEPNGELTAAGASLFPPRQPGYGTAMREGVGGWLLTPTGGVPGIVSAVTGGAGAEAGGELFGGSALAKVAGGFLGGMAGGSVASRVGQRLSPQASALAKEGLEGITPAMLSEAEAFQKASAAKGVQIDLAQALEAVGAPASNLTTIRNFLAGKKQGDNVQRVLREQPGQLSMEAGQFTARLPGENYGVGQAANNLQEVATQRIKDVMTQRSQLWVDTMEGTRKALIDAAKVRQSLAQGGMQGAAFQVDAASRKLQQLQEVLQKAQAGDAVAIARANDAVSESQRLVESLKSFALPRGQTTSPRGNFTPQVQRGQSIINDQITREVQAGKLENAIPPQVQSAPSLETLTAQKGVQAGQTELAQAQASLTAAERETQAAGRQLSAATAVPEAAVARAQQRLLSMADGVPNTKQGAMLRNLASKFQTPDGYVTDPNALNLILREAAEKLKDPNLAARGVDKAAAKAISDSIASTRNTLGESFKPIREANAAYSQFTTDVLDPLRQGPVGQFAGKGYDPAVQAGMTKFEALMKEGVDVNSKNSAIRTLAKELAKTDPNAVPDALKSYVSKNIQKALEPGPTAQTAANNPDMAQRIADSLFANEMQAQGLRDAVAESAKHLGQDPAEMVRGLNNFMQLTRALKSRPQTVGGLQSKEIFEIGGRTIGADALRIFGFLPFERAARRLEDTVLGATLKKFDTILTSPDGAKMLAELGKVDPGSKRAAMIIATMAGTSATNPANVDGQ